MREAGGHIRAAALLSRYRQHPHSGGRRRWHALWHRHQRHHLSRGNSGIWLRRECHRGRSDGRKSGTRRVLFLSARRTPCISGEHQPVQHHDALKPRPFSTYLYQRHFCPDCEPGGDRKGGSLLLAHHLSRRRVRPQLARQHSHTYWAHVGCAHRFQRRFRGARKRAPPAKSYERPVTNAGWGTDVSVQYSRLFRTFN
jgi:hypothetical protein